MNRHVKHRMKRYLALAALYALEATAASIPTGIAAAVLIPLGVRLRGLRAYGGEYLVLAVVYWASFTLANKYVCDQIFGEKKTPQPGKRQREKGSEKNGIAGNGRAVSRNTDTARRAG